MRGSDYEYGFRSVAEMADELDKRLSPHAVLNNRSDERLHVPKRSDRPREVATVDIRTPFQRDRDRIVHSRAFRRLRGKTQVFLTIKGDHYRSRLSHTLEVMQLARTIARRLGLNEDLTEAIALGHDLGHTPFGHAGEFELSSILRGKVEGLVDIDAGGFAHNYHSLTVVDHFEQAYPDFSGLNLCRAVREGIWKHTDITKDGPKATDDRLDVTALRPDHKCPTSLEGQIVHICDEIAQITHDLEDAFRAGFIGRTSFQDQLMEKFRIFRTSLRWQPADLSNTARFRATVISPLISLLVGDLVKATERRIKDITPSPYYEEFYIAFSTRLGREFEMFRDEVYTGSLLNHEEIRRMDAKGRYIVRQLFRGYLEMPQRLPDVALTKARERMGRDPLSAKDTGSFAKTIPFVRSIAEHIAGMTDSYAIEEFRRIYTGDFRLILDG